jgi:cell division protein FtsZ
VQDEKMGEEVKITVIATGFRDQMPERRARMLSVEEVPVISVPVVAPVSRVQEAVAPVAAAPIPPAPPAPAPPRFLSQDEDEESRRQQKPEPTFFSAATPASAGQPLHIETAPELDSHHEMEFTGARPKFAELSEEPAYTPLPRDYAPEFVGGNDSSHSEDQDTQPAPVNYSSSDEEGQRDLDVPAFMRRLRF